MKVLAFTRPNNLRRLGDELLAEIPGLAPRAISGPDGSNIQVATFQLSGTTTTVTLTVPDSADEVAIAAVVAAHDPTPDVPPPVPQFGSDSATVDQVADAVTQLRAYLALPAPNNAQTIAAFKLLIRVVLFVLRRLL